MCKKMRLYFINVLQSIFSSFSLGVPCPVNYNPADYFVQILAIAPNREQECRATIKKICDTFAVSPLAKDINTVASNIGTHDEQIAFKCKTNGNGYRASWWIQFYAILWRSWLSVLKEPMLVKVRILQTTVS
jgi:ATP-binding cassette, subfamily G (WHITE), eye pigment precursor transporter